jgi:Holliday junction DNA helicase RuvB
VLEVLIESFGGGPVGVSSLAVSIGEDSETIEAVVEPFLIREGLVVRTPRGRVATRSGWEHLGLTPPANDPTLL